MITTIVVPCFNEATRLPIDEFHHYLSKQYSTRFVFIDDGSTDGTIHVLYSLGSRNPDQVEVIRLNENQGKAEAVRQGILRALDNSPDFVGYWDADLATPLDTISEFELLFQERPEIDVVMGSRIKLLGRDIRRQLFRHYTGRCFATVASLILGIGVYDTQCGAKLFRVTSWMKHIFEKPFLTKWVFDVEIIARLLRCVKEAEKCIFEFPLHRWVDVPGSKVKFRDGGRAAFDLLRILFCYRLGWRHIENHASVKSGAGSTE